MNRQADNMNSNDSKKFRSGFVTLAGRPNVGKSTLMNRILGEKVAIVSPKPQTTRNRLLGIKHVDDRGQIVFIDTPGIHKAQGRLNRQMVEYAYDAMNDADILVLMIDAIKTDLNRGMSPVDVQILGRLAKLDKPIFLIINKVDKVKKTELLPFLDKVKDLHPFAAIFPISALRGVGADDVVEALLERLPEGSELFPKDQITDLTMRFLAAEVIREKILLFCHEEIPYSVAIEIERFLEMDDGKRVHIDAAVFVERDSQKGIIIGKGGQMLTRIGSEARKDLEKMFDMKVGLKLFIKEERNWTENPYSLRRFGYGK